MCPRRLSMCSLWVSVLAWVPIKMNIGVCAYQSLVRLCSFLILSLQILSFWLHTVLPQATLRYTQRSKHIIHSSGLGQKCTPTFSPFFSLHLVRKKTAHAVRQTIKEHQNKRIGILPPKVVFMKHKGTKNQRTRLIQSSERVWVLKKSYSTLVFFLFFIFFMYLFFTVIVNSLPCF